MDTTGRKVKDKNRKRKRKLADWQESHRVGAEEKVHKVKRCQVPLTPVPGATWWDQCHILRLSQTASNPF